MDKFLADARVALRSLRRSPSFVATACAILAIGIGMAAAMYTVFTTVLVDRLPVVEQDRLVVMHPLDRRGTHLDAPFPYLPQIARDSALFRGVAGIAHLGAQPLPFIDGSTTLTFAAAGASANYFDVLGMRPELGRLFRREDGQPGAQPVIVLSHAAWRRFFGGNPSIVGRVLVMPYTEQRARIVGVAPPGFPYPSGVEAWYSLGSDFGAQVDIIARLAPNVTLDAARQGLLALIQRSNPFESVPARKGQPPVHIEISGVEALSLTDTLLGASRPTLVALTLAVGLLLLIACVNVGNLLLVRLLAREREIAVRHAIGASHADVARLFLIESSLLAVVGGTLGCLVAVALLRVLGAVAPPQLPRVDALSASHLPLGATAGILVFATLAFGLLPSVMGSRVQSYALLRSDTRTGSEGRSKRRTRRWLVVTQMALALVMLSGAALLVRTLSRLQSMDLGYRPEHLSILSFTGPERDLPNNERIFDVAKRVVQRIQVTHDVVAATPIESGPFRGQSLFIMQLVRADLPASERETAPFVPWEFVGPDYFRTFGIPIRSGRALLSSDTKTAEKVIVVNETLARRLWPGQDPIGKHARVKYDSNTYTVVGVAADTHFRELRNTGPIVYFNWEQVGPFWNGLVAVRTSAPLVTMMPALRSAIHDA
ncbi:MAG TPA: ABC transporter permease, partial [Gemmatimonadaceae bacterium]|nr:ABC transporter permease [Gemmatimonadaceae bacterium]